MIDTTVRRRRLLAAELGVLTVTLAVVPAAAAAAAPEPVPADAVRGALAVMAVLWTWSLGYVAYSLDAVPGLLREVPSPTIGVANYVTIFRAGLYCVAGGLMIVPPVGWVAWGPAVVYGVGALLDQVDGLVARTIGHETALGRRLDMAVDTLGFVVAPAVAVAWGQLPAWYLSLSAARYVYRGLTSLRRLRGLPVFELPDGELSRHLAGLQMAFLTVALTPVVSPATAGAVAPFALAPSLVVFLRDYLIVAGHLSAESALSRY